MPAPQDATALGNGSPTARARRAPGGGFWGALLLACIVLPCVLGAPWAFGAAGGSGGGSAGAPRYRAEDLTATRVPPWWAAPARHAEPDATAPSSNRPATQRRFLIGSDALGRDLLARCIAGGAISLGVGASAALISVVIGVLYGMVAGYVGGRTDAAMMRIVDVLYGLPYILLVVLLAVAAAALADRREQRAMGQMHADRAAFVERALAAPPPPADPAQAAERKAEAEAAAASAYPPPPEARSRISRVATLIVAIGGVSWLTMARVVRGQTLSLRARPFVEGARAIGASPPRILLRHILPNLAAPIVVYATLTVPQAILQESFLSFLGIGAPAPLPSWGNLVADGLSELNTVRSRWWLLLFPCLLLTVSLLAMNLVGDALRRRLDPRARGA